MDEEQNETCAEEANQVASEIKPSMHYLTMKYLIVFLAVVATATRLQALSNDLYGVIEIGSSGVKPLVVKAHPPKEILNESEDTEQTVDSFNVTPVKVDDLNPLLESQADNVAQAVLKVRQQMIDTMGVPLEHIYVVGSSGLGSQPSKVGVEAKVNERLGIKMEFITSEREAELAMRGVMDTLPPQWRSKRYKEVLFLDIGSGNSRGAYMGSADPIEIKSFELPWGTKSFAGAVDKARKDLPFGTVADDLISSTVRPAMQEAVQLHPGLQNLNRYYIAGGASFALATILHPGDYQEFVPLQRGDIKTFIAAAADAAEAVATEVRKPGDKKLTIEEFAHNRLQAFLKDVPSAKREEIRAKAEDDLQRVFRKIFSGNQMIAASKLLQTMDAEFGIDRKKVFFSRPALYAWPLGYVAGKMTTTK